MISFLTKVKFFKVNNKFQETANANKKYRTKKRVYGYECDYRNRRAIRKVILGPY